MSTFESGSSWTEEEWDPVAIARKKRNEMKQKMSEAAREEQRKHEEELKKIEEEKKKQEEKKRLEEIKREEQKKAKQQKKLKEAEKPKKEEKISLTYSKKELKKAEELKREKQREKDLKLKKEKEEKKEIVEKEIVEKPVEVVKDEQQHSDSLFPPLIVALVISFILFVLVIRYFYTYRILFSMQPASSEQLVSISEEIRAMFGDDIVELSEVKQEGKVNFQSFADLARFYSMLSSFLNISLGSLQKVTSIRSVTIHLFV